MVSDYRGDLKELERLRNWERIEVRKSGKEKSLLSAPSTVSEDPISHSRTTESRLRKDTQVCFSCTHFWKFFCYRKNLFLIQNSFSVSSPSVFCFSVCHFQEHITDYIADAGLQSILSRVGKVWKMSEQQLVEYISKAVIFNDGRALLHLFYL